jgi:hypothetical protein
MASQTAENIISLAYNKAGKSNYKLMSDAILFYDMLEDINKGRYKSGDSLPFGLTVEMVIKKASDKKIVGLEISVFPEMFGDKIQMCVFEV